MNSLISVIIPTFNRAESLKKAIESVLSQSYEDWELIIVDNSSNDNTQLLVKDYENEKVKFITVENKGIIAYSRNIGIDNAKGKYVAFLDSDDWWESQKLEKAIKSLINNKADIAYHDCNLLSSLSKSKTNCRSLKNNTLNDLAINGNAVVTSSVVVLKERLKDVGGFDESIEIVGWEDYHLWLKLALRSNKFCKLSGVLASCWAGEDNFDNPKRILLNLIEIEKYFIKDLSEIIQISRVWWIPYTAGKAYLNLGSLSEAKKSLNEVVFNSSPLTYKLKSMYYLMLVIPFMRR